MFKLSSVIIAILISFNGLAQSPHGDKLEIKCDVCHSAANWLMKAENTTFNHSQTSFPLTGQHMTVDCKLCHVDLVFSNAKTNCISCHKDMHQQTVGLDCERCHTPRSWIVQNITEIHQLSRFPLNATHSKADCYQCHKSASLLRFDPMGISCVDCHLKDYNATTNPPHIINKYPNDCLLCHKETSWQPATFNHNVNTSFPLKGGHIGIDCISCHSKGYGSTSTICASCHLANYNSSTNPSHTAAKFSNDCKLCHTEISWKPSNYNHNTSTTFPLSGAHIDLSCIACHTKGYAGISTECVSCHLTDYNATTNPSHTTAKYSTDCKICHTVSAWKPSTFDHNTATTFPLTGAHTGLACISCHAKGYTGTPTACESCHMANYTATTNPGHVSAKFSTDCKLCHVATSWSPATFNHTTGTTFPLTGLHIGVTCISCHTSGYVGISTACASCHLPKYNATTNPSHVAAKFPTSCETCHATAGWTPSNFNHNTGTTFPLTGAHINTTCISCHTTGYTGISSACESCHMTNYAATTNPGHVAAKFSTDCKICHTPSAWSPTTFNHTTNTTYPLTGSHIGISCISCHSAGYAGISTTCLSCHLAKYTTTTNPAHSTAKFPTNCETCHTITVWTTSTYNHDSQYFRINSGKHNGKWTLCSECHTNSTNYAVFNCLLCHEHNQASTDSEHKGKTGYAYNSTNCYSCHPKI